MSKLNKPSELRPWADTISKMSTGPQEQSHPITQDLRRELYQMLDRLGPAVMATPTSTTREILTDCALLIGQVLDETEGTARG